MHAVRNGVRRAHILDGRIPHVLLLEIFTDEGIGTMVAMTTHALRHVEPTADRCPFMPIYAPPPVTFVRGRAPSCGTATASATSTSSAASR